MKFEKSIKNKIFNNESEFEELLKLWRSEKQKLVFTNGCFDILHRGHVDSLIKSADFGDKLILGLNSDESVRILKGSNRPILDQYSRALMLASFIFVDAIVIFNTETPYKLIDSIQPDVLVKGKDYAVEEIAGYDIVLGKGGTVETIELTPGFSTTDIINKLRKE